MVCTRGSFVSSAASQLAEVPVTVYLGRNCEGQ